MAGLDDILATWPRSKWAALWLTLYLGFAILIAFLNGMHHYRLAKGGVKTVGIVKGKEPENHQMIRYLYVVGQSQYAGGESVGGRFEQLKVGAPVEIFYLPDEANVSCMCDPVSEWREDKFAMLAVPIMFSTFIVCVALARADNRKKANGGQGA